MQMNKTCEQALSYLDKGMSVICLNPKDKTPIKSWRAYQKKKPTPFTIKKWWNEHPDANMGIVTGAVSGNLVVLDVDPRNGGLESIKGKHLPPTPTVKTGGKGFHYYYRSEKPIKSTKIGKGLDLKAEGGYVVAPPSVHPNGSSYEWADGLSFADIECQPVPDWIQLHVAISSPTPSKPDSPEHHFEQPIDKLVQLLKPHWVKGQRHDLSLSLAGFLAKRRWSWEETESLIRVLCEGDEEALSRINTVKDTFEKFFKGARIVGFKGLSDVLPPPVLSQVLKIIHVIDGVRIREIIVSIRRNEGLPTVERRRIIAELVLKDLRRRFGDFLVTDEPQYYFFEKESKTVYPFDSRDMKSFIDAEYDISSNETECRGIIDHLISHTHRSGRKTKIYHLCHFDKGKHCLYINLNRGRMARLNGTAITIVDNGTDGILFMDEMDPILVKPGDSHPHLRSVFFKDVNFSNTQDRELQEILCWAWLRTLFFFELLPTRPIMALIGPKGSGKTFLLKVLLRLIYGSVRSEPDSITKEDAFEASLSNNYFLAVDNVDERLVWLNDALAKAATGQVIRKRQLYTTNDEIRFQPRCFVALSSRTPRFKREDVSDRLLIIRLDRLKEGEFTREEVLLAPFTGINRFKVWGALLTELNSCVHWLKENQPTQKSQHRLADWEALASTFADKDGEKDRFVQALNAMEEERVEFVLEDDPITNLVAKFLDGQWRSANEIWQAAGEKESGFRNSTSLGIQIKNKEETLRKAYGMELHHDGHAKMNLYRFPVPTAQADQNGSKFDGLNLSPETHQTIETIDRHFGVKKVTLAGDAGG